MYGDGGKLRIPECSAETLQDCSPLILSFVTRRRRRRRCARNRRQIKSDILLLNSPKTPDFFVHSSDYSLTRHRGEKLRFYTLVTFIRADQIIFPQKIMIQKLFVPSGRLWYYVFSYFCHAQLHFQWKDFSTTSLRIFYSNSYFDIYYKKPWSSHQE